MPTPAPVDAKPQPSFPVRVKTLVMPFLAPYYLVVGGALGALTAGFVAVIVLLILVTANFNVLGWME